MTIEERLEKVEQELSRANRRIRRLIMGVVECFGIAAVVWALKPARCRGHTPHIRRIGEEKLGRRGRKRYPARRWVVERTLSWLSKCRAILIRYDKKASNYLGMIQLACALLWCRRLSVLR